MELHWFSFSCCTSVDQALIVGEKPEPRNRKATDRQRAEPLITARPVATENSPPPSLLFPTLFRDFGTESVSAELIMDKTDYKVNPPCWAAVPCSGSLSELACELGGKTCPVLINA